MASRTSKAIFGLLLLAFFAPALTRANEVHSPDSPGYNKVDSPAVISFDAVRLRSVQPAPVQIPEGCDGKYRAGMESAFRKIWAQCQEIGRSEPSDCQRALFDRCTKVGNELLTMERGTCIEMHGEKDALNRIMDPDNQKNSQVSASDLNSRAAAASRRVANALGKNAQELSARKAAATAALRANACAFSSSAVQYKQTEAKVISELTQVESFVKSQAEAKKAAADQFQKISGTSASSASQLKSTVAVNASNQASLAASGDASTITGSTSTYTVTDQSGGGVVNPSVPTTTTTVSVSTVTSTSVSSYTLNVPKPVAPIPYPDINTSSEREIPKWVPILAIGVPAAILGGLLISKIARGGKGGGDSSGGDNSGGDNSGGGSPGGSDSGTPDPRPGPGVTNPSADPVPGNQDVRALGMQVDSAFTDREKAIIAESVNRTPNCVRYKLKSLVVRRANLNHRRAEAGKCVAGTFTLGGNTVRLDPGCAMGVGITVHEFFHVIGNRNGNQLHIVWRDRILTASPNCPVSRYGATNLYEDFAEAGRLLIMPDRDRNGSACVTTKISGLRQAVNSCSQ